MTENELSMLCIEIDWIKENYRRVNACSECDTCEECLSKEECDLIDTISYITDKLLKHRKELDFE